MAFGLRAVKGYGKLLLVVPAWLLLTIVAAVVQWVVDENVTTAGLLNAVSAASAALLSHWALISGWLLALTFGAMILLAYLDERRAVRALPVGEEWTPPVVGDMARLLIEVAKRSGVW